MHNALECTNALLERFIRESKAVEIIWRFFRILFANNHVYGKMINIRKC